MSEKNEQVGGYFYRKNAEQMQIAKNMVHCELSQESRKRIAEKLVEVAKMIENGAEYVSGGIIVHQTSKGLEIVSDLVIEPVGE